MNYIKVWCEYDINGSFGGNNNEEVLGVSEDATTEAIDEAVLKHVMDATGLPEDEIEGLYDWEYLGIKIILSDI